MAVRVHAHQSQFEPRIVEKQGEQLTPSVIRSAVDRAGRRIAPLWSLRNFVAVNPYLGLLDQSFEAAAEMLGRRAGAHMTAPRAFYAQAIQDGRITDADLEAALADGHQMPGALQSAEALKVFADSASQCSQWTPLPTAADAAQAVTVVNWGEFVTESISAWAGSYFDQGQSYWKSPWADLPPFAAWRAEAMHDRAPQVRGVRDFHKTLRALPDSAMEAITAALNILDIPVSGLDAYLHRLLLTIHGWASYARYRLWQAELYNQHDEALTDLLAIRLVWEVALLNAFADQGISQVWQAQKLSLSHDTLDEAARRELANDLLLQNAFEKAYQRELLNRLCAAAPMPSSLQTAERKQVQAVFCIDVRSEVFRRAFETVNKGIETIGFAGFFGFPITYVRLDEAEGGAQCPVLLTPQFVITETVSGASSHELTAVTRQRAIVQRAAKAWRMFKFGAVSCFGFVGPVGLAYVRNLLRDTFGWGHPVPNPAAFGLDKTTVQRLSPDIDPHQIGSQITGMTPSQRLDAAEGALRAMSLTEHFARIVLLTGHGSTTVNNPYATGLDCGACGGHTGEANARVAAQVFNDPAVRSGLKARGIAIPDDTIFVAALHDTTTDAVTLFDVERIPASHADDLCELQANLEAAGQLARAERALLLKIEAGEKIDRAVIHRSRDWSQVRPEWGLAGCAAFIAAPRARTNRIDLDGRAFLHSYEWRQDEGFKVLELIMTAPMVVASWINLQYYGSTVDNAFFGSGNKTLHNVIGTLGVVEGNGGDLRVGLPWQSVHDGERYVHEPVRLNVIIEAPVEAITAILVKHEQVRQLVDHGWIHLFVMDETGRTTHRYAGDLNWRPL
jgi:uncharacterized protein YbcC (UPF0753/DUF2309 family)